MENEQPANIAAFVWAQCAAIRLVSFVDEVNISILNSSMCTQVERAHIHHMNMEQVWQEDWETFVLMRFFPCLE